MSKKRNRTSHRATSKKKQTRNFYIGTGIFIALLVAIGAYLVLNQPPEVSASRLELETSIGADDATVTIYEFGAYGCSSCRATHQRGFNEQIETLIERPEYKDKVRFVFVNYPVISQNDPLSAEVGQCVLDQDEEAFWTFHNAIYGISDAEYASMRDAGDYIEFANRQGLDGDALDECLANDTHKRTVQHHKERAEDRFVRGTPTFFVNDQQVSVDITQIEQLIQNNLNS